jgi:hypothetical protein
VDGSTSPHASSKFGRSQPTFRTSFYSFPLAQPLVASPQMVPSVESLPILALNPLQLIVETKPPPLDRGVFTTSTQITSGTIIEESPVLVFGKEEWEENGRKTLLDHYAFVWGKQGKMAVALGMGSSELSLSCCCFLQANTS